MTIPSLYCESDATCLPNQLDSGYGKVIGYVTYSSAAPNVNRTLNLDQPATASTNVLEMLTWPEENELSSLLKVKDANPVEEQQCVQYQRNNNPYESCYNCLSRFDCLVNIYCLIIHVSVAA